MIQPTNMSSDGDDQSNPSLWERISHWMCTDPARSFFWFSLGIGVFLRLYVFAGGRMLWLDESMIALNLMTRSSAELLEPLNFLQIAPAGWLIANKFALEITGSVDYGLRLVALITGLGALGLFAWLSRRLFSLPVAASITLVFALSGTLVRYSVELKPYGADVFFTLAILALVMLIWETSGRKARLSVGALALTGLVGLTFSFPLVYVLGGSGGILILRLWLSGRRLDAALLVAAAVSWLVVFIALMKILYLVQAEGAGFGGGGVDTFFDRTGYAPFPPTSVTDLVWYPRWAHHTVKFLFGEFSAYFGLILAGAGSVLMARKRPWVLATIVAPLAFALLGSMLKAYPLFERLTLFALPLVLLLVAQTFEAIRAELSTRARVPVMAGAVFAFSVGSLFSLFDGLRSRPAFAMQDLGPALQIIEAEIQPGDWLVANTGAVSTYLIYRHRYGLENAAWLVLNDAENAGACLTNQLADMQPGEQVWSLNLDPLAHPKTPAAMPDFAEMLPGSTLSVQVIIADPQMRLDVITPNTPPQRNDLESLAGCEPQLDITKELLGGRPPALSHTP